MGEGEPKERPLASVALLSCSHFLPCVGCCGRCTVLRDALQHPCTGELPMAFHQPLPFLSPLRIPPSASETQFSSSCHALGPKQMPCALQGSRCSPSWDLGGQEGGWPY